MTLRVLMMTQWYDPEGGSAAQASVIARSLARRGAHVEVLTGFPNYPTGEVAQGYRVRAYQREVLDGITVHRAPLWPSHDASATRRAANYLSWSAGATMVALSKVPKADAVLVHSTPATAALPALAVRATRGTPFVVHVQDLWPETVLTSEFLSHRGQGFARRPLDAMCNAIYRRASSVAVTSPGMAPLIEARGVPTERIHFAANWADECVFRPVERSQSAAETLGLTRRFTVMYAGNMGPYQSLDTLLDAADRLRDRPDIGFALVGNGVRQAHLRDAVARRNLESVTFVPPVPFTQMTSVLALGDAHLISLADLPLFRTTLPSKLQATLASGKPVIGAVTGDAARVIRTAKAGPVVTPGDDAALAAAIRGLADLPPDGLARLGAAARNHYVSEFSEDIAAQTLLTLLQSAALTPTRRGVTT